MRTAAKCHPEKPVHCGTQCETCYKRDQRRARWLVKKYGITIKQYNRLLAYQKGRCAVCGNTPKTRALAVDHNHRTKFPRGLLCHHCNRAIGWLADKPEIALSIQNYLESPPAERLRKQDESFSGEFLDWAQDAENRGIKFARASHAQPPEIPDELVVIEPSGQIPPKPTSHE